MLSVTMQRQSGEPEQPKKSSALWLYWIGAALLIYFIYKVADIISLFLISGVLAYILNIFVEIFEKRGIARTWAITLVFVLGLLLAASLSFLLLPPLFQQVSQIESNITSYLRDIHSAGQQAVNPRADTDVPVDLRYFIAGLAEKYPSLIESLGGIEKVSAYVASKQAEMASIGLRLLGNATSWIMGFAGRILNIVLIPIFTLYFLFAARSMKMRMNYLIGCLSFKKEVRSIIAEINIMMGRYLKGQLLVVVLISVSVTLISYGLSLFFGNQYSLFLGCVVGLLSVIPYFGMIVSVIVAAVIALASSSVTPWLAALILVGLLLLINQIFDNIITPKVVGEQVGLHPLWSIFALLVAGKYLGFFGMLFAVPIAAAVKILLSHFFPVLFAPLDESVQAETAGEISEEYLSYNGRGERSVPADFSVTRKNDRSDGGSMYLRLPTSNPGTESPVTAEEVIDERGPKGFRSRRKTAISPSKKPRALKTAVLKAAPPVAVPVPAKEPAGKASGESASSAAAKPKAAEKPQRASSQTPRKTRTEKPAERRRKEPAGAAEPVQSSVAAAPAVEAPAAATAVEIPAKEPAVPRKKFSVVADVAAMKTKPPVSPAETVKIEEPAEKTVPAPPAAAGNAAPKAKKFSIVADILKPSEQAAEKGEPVKPSERTAEKSGPAVASAGTAGTREKPAGSAPSALPAEGASEVSLPGDAGKDAQEPKKNVRKTVRRAVRKPAASPKPAAAGETEESAPAPAPVKKRRYSARRKPAVKESVSEVSVQKEEKPSS